MDKFVYHWSYDVTVGRRNDHHEHGHCIYTPKQIEDFKNSKWKLCFDLAKYVTVKLKPSDIIFIRLCTEKEFLENKLAQTLCCIDNIIGSFKAYYDDCHTGESDEDDSDEDNSD